MVNNRATTRHGNIRCTHCKYKARGKRYCNRSKRLIEPDVIGCNQGQVY